MSSQLLHFLLFLDEPKRTGEKKGKGKGKEGRKGGRKEGGERKTKKMENNAFAPSGRPGFRDPHVPSPSESGVKKSGRNYPLFPTARTICCLHFRIRPFVFIQASTTGLVGSSNHSLTLSLVPALMFTASGWNDSPWTFFSSLLSPPFDLFSSSC